VKKELGILGAGMVTDAISHVSEIWDSPAAGRAGQMEAEAVASQDVLSQLGVRAVHQAWTMAGIEGFASEKIGLIVESAWGNVDSTVAYLESMLEAEGRYASPRHFSRSVYSSVASVVAIHFGIRGPCETLVFAQRPVGGVLGQAWRLMAAGRCERVVALWVDQGGEVAADLTRRAAEGLKRREFARYKERGLGYGAVAMVVAADGDMGRFNLEEWDEAEASRRAEGRGGKRFALDGAVEFLRGVANGSKGLADA
jgi:3-oxoacyl-[acyl-carrier-protein] synthase II